jgi:preprotein translocase subunit SecE
MNAVDKTRNFLRDVRVEMSKVNWPSRDQLVSSTGVVIVLVFLFTIFIGIVDRIISTIIEKLILNI